MKAALIAGPTASGKSALALNLARALKAEGREAWIVNADASQIYEGLPIVSAAPPAHEMAEIPHLLFGCLDPTENCNAVRWAEMARSVIGQAEAQGVIPILVGGTGLYIRTLLDGIAPVPEIAAEIREEVRARSVADAYARLAQRDPQSAARLDPRDTTRVQRALEVVESSGRTIGDWQAQLEGGIGHQLDLAPAILLPPRAWLRERCALRWDVMMAAGALEEVAAFRQRDLDPMLPAMRAIGVPELIDLLDGNSSEAQAAERAVAATRQYAKRQYTWFRNQPPADWPRFAEELNDEEISKIVIMLRQRLLTA